ncbi:hypothetical protein PPOP_1848, partial [Paenibacillus popilliae ATCC 14706]
YVAAFEIAGLAIGGIYVHPYCGALERLRLLEERD